ncbi:MAG: AEC family transporter [Bacteroidota bacterium]
MGPLVVAFETVLPLFLVIFAGVLFSRTKASSEHWIDILNKYALWIGFPALVITSLMHLEIGENNYTPLIVANSVYIIVSILLAFPIAWIFKLSAGMKRSLFLILPFGNVAYLGIPVLRNAWGDEILPVAAIISAIYVFWMLTLALILIEVYGHHKINAQKLLLSLLKNPLLLSVFAGLAIVLFNINLPDFLEKTIGLFSDSVTAVVLFSLGIFLGMHQLGNIREWKQVLIWSVVAMIILPAAFFLIIQFLPMPEDQVKATIVDAAMPLGLTPYALSVQYKLKTTLMARIVVLSTLLSMIIIPLWMVVTG